jgi:hypothetical protein
MLEDEAGREPTQAVQEAVVHVAFRIAPRDSWNHGRVLCLDYHAPGDSLPDPLWLRSGGPRAPEP